MKPRNNNFRYFITWTVGHNGYKEREVFPINSDALKIKSEQDNQRLFFRKKLDGSPILIDNSEVSDYSFMKSLEAGQIQSCSAWRTMGFEIRRLVSQTWTTFWKGQFNIYNCMFNDDRCTVEITDMDVNDKYSILLNELDTEVNLFEVTPVIQCTSQGYDFEVEEQVVKEYNVSVTGWWDNSTSCFQLQYTGWVWPYEFAGNYLWSQYWVPISSIYNNVDAVHGKFNLTTKWIRGYLVTLNDSSGNPVAPDTSNTWVQDIATTLAGLPATKWLKNMQPNNVNYYNLVYLGGCNDFEWSCKLISNEIVYKYNRRLTDVIAFVVNKFTGLTNFQSRFFNDGVNPVTQSLNNYQNVFIGGKSDYKNPYNTECQTLANLTFSMLEQWLRECWYVFWDIDDNGKFIFEHYTYWNKVVGRNLQALDGGRWIKGTNSYSYIDREYYRKERWEYMEHDGLDFEGMDIEYYACSQLLSKDGVKDHSINKVTTDLKFIETQPQEISNEGFVIVACQWSVADNKYIVISDTGLASFQIIRNAPMSIANLQEAFFIYNRLFPVGKLNHSMVTFQSSMKKKKQVDVKFPLCSGDTLDETKLIRTNMGDGEVYASSFSIRQEVITVTLLYQ